MPLAAVRLGAGVPEADFSATVAEVHGRACLLDCADAGLLTLAIEELGGLPRGITLATPPGFAFKGALTEGALAAARGGVLRIAGGALAVDLRRARPWRSALGALGLDSGREAVRAAWQAALMVVAADGRGDGLRAIGGDAIAALGAARRAGNADVAAQAVTRLVGLGAGRTPSGDDYLVGFIAGLLAGGDAERLATALRARVRTLALRTNRVSRLYLEAAADGEVSERLHAVAAVIAAGGDAAAVQRAVTAALAVGHDSGAAGVLGLLDACAPPAGP